MSNVFIAFLITLGLSTWIYTKFLRRSYNDTNQSLLVIGIIALFIFVVTVFFLSTLSSLAK